MLQLALVLPPQVSMVATAAECANLGWYALFIPGIALDGDTPHSAAGAVFAALVVRIALDRRPATRLSDADSEVALQLCGSV